MIPGILVEQLPGQIHLFGQGNNAAAGTPLAAATITIIIVSTAARGIEDVLNPPDQVSVVTDLRTTTHGLKRFGGLWFVDVFLFQTGGPATLELRERTFDALTQAAPGVTDTTRAVWLRQVRDGIAFRATWRLCNAEARINYVNGAANTVNFDLNVQLRAA